MAAQLTDTTDLTLARLDEMARQDGMLPELLTFYRGLLLIQARVGHELNTPDPGLDPDMVRVRNEEGKPMLSPEEMSFDPPLLQSALQEVSDLFGKHASLFASTAEEISSLTSNGANEETVRAWLNGPVPERAGSADSPLLQEMLRAAIRPFLTAHARPLADLVDQPSWRHGYCPVCGGNPDFAYLEADNGARWLVCCRCDTTWAFQRLECPYCGSTDQDTLSYFTDDKSLYRLYVCEQCHRYLKTIDLRKAEETVLIPLERLLTLEIDAQARGLGYLPCQ